MKARNTDCLPRKVAGSSREATLVATSKAIGAGLSKPFGAQTVPLCDLDVRHGALGFNVCPAGLQLKCNQTKCILHYGMNSMSLWGPGTYEVSPTGSILKAWSPAGSTILGGAETLGGGV